MAVKKEFYSVEEVAKILDLSLDRVYEYLRQGDIKGSRITHSSTWRVHKDELERIRGGGFPKLKEQAAGKPEVGPHQDELRKMIAHIDDWIRDWSRPVPLTSRGEVAMPYAGQTLRAGQPVDSDPVYLALKEHLGGTEVWKDFNRYQTLRQFYWCWIAPLPHHFEGSPEWVRSREEKLVRLRRNKDRVWRKLNELTDKVSRGFRELTLQNRIPGRCRWCPDGP
ncbi:MAG: helix-turn-helix domain-containing protein [Chloroflexi bacterium]|nr:helix-turn-helix domain-containing protein [Chloroflexota bacterium]